MCSTGICRHYTMYLPPNKHQFGGKPARIRRQNSSVHRRGNGDSIVEGSGFRTSPSCVCPAGRLPRRQRISAADSICVATEHWALWETARREGRGGVWRRERRSSQGPGVRTEVASPSEVGRGVRVEAYGEGRDEDCGSAKPRQGEALCAERQGAAISREVTRQSRAARIGDGLAESCLKSRPGPSDEPAPPTRHRQGAKRGHD